MIFIESFIWVFQRIMAGRTAQARSVAMVAAVDVYDNPSMEVTGEHLASPDKTRLWSQLASTGRHRSKMPMKVVRNVAMVKPSRK